MTHGAPSGRQRRPDDQDAFDEDDDSTATPPPPDGGFGWVVVFASFAIHVVTDGVTYSFGVMQQELVNYFHVGQGEASWIVSILTGITLCSGPVSSAFVNKYGCRTVTIAGSVLATICLAASYFAPNVPTLYLTVGLGTGLGFGLIYLPAVVSVTCYFEKYRSMATGIAVCGSGLGTFIFAPLIGHLISEYGWRGTLLIIAGLVFETAVMGALFRPLEDNKHKRSRTPDDKAAELSGIELKTLLPNGTTDTNKDKTTKLLSVPMADRWPNSTGQLNVNGDIRSRSLEHHINSRHIKGKSLHFPPDQGNNVHHHHRHHHHHHNHHSHHNRDITRLARSQPSLQVSGGTGTTTSTHHLAGAGVMYRKDIFYQRSLINIPHHGSIAAGLTEAQSQRMGGGGGGGGVTGGSFKVHKASVGSASETDDDSVSDRAIMCGCVPCSRETKDTLTEMLDFSLFKDKIFIIFTISNLLTSIGFYIPFVFIAPLGESVGVSKARSEFLVSIVGVANTVGRIVLGYLSDKTWINRLFVYNASLTTCGVATVLAVFCPDFYTLSVYASVFGFTIGAYVGLTSVIVVDLFGLDKLTNAFGLLLLFQGIASFLGAPLAGWLYDVTGTFSYAFYLSGITIAVSGLMLFFIKAPAKTSDALKAQTIKSADADANGNGNGKSAIAAV